MIQTLAKWCLFFIFYFFNFWLWCFFSLQRGCPQQAESDDGGQSGRGLRPDADEATRGHGGRHHGPQVPKYRGGDPHWAPREGNNPQRRISNCTPHLWHLTHSSYYGSCMCQAGKVVSVSKYWRIFFWVGLRVQEYKTYSVCAFLPKTKVWPTCDVTSSQSEPATDFRDRLCATKKKKIHNILPLWTTM